MAMFKKKPVIEDGSDLDKDIEKKLNKFPKKQREHLRMLYQQYKEGRLIFPEGVDKEKFLNKK